MISYKQCEEMVGVKPEYPRTEYGYRAYKNGECKVFYTSKEANEFSKLVERLVVNEEEYNLQKEAYYAYETKVFELWITELKSEFDLPEKVFSICYSEAYDRGHSAGYDEVASYMCDVVEFYEKIMKAVEETKLELGK